MRLVKFGRKAIQTLKCRTGIYLKRQSKIISNSSKKQQWMWHVSSNTLRAVCVLWTVALVSQSRSLSKPDSAGRLPLTTKIVKQIWMPDYSLFVQEISGHIEQILFFFILHLLNIYGSSMSLSQAHWTSFYIPSIKPGIHVNMYICLCMHRLPVSYK